MKISKNIIVLFFCICFLGCVSSSYHRLQDLDIPMTLLRQELVRHIPFGAREVSMNNRTFYSEYFFFQPPNHFHRVEQEVLASGMQEVFFAEFVIWGSTRPYEVHVKVHRRVFDRNRRQYVSIGTHEKAAEALIESIRLGIKMRREDGRFIEGFRAF